MNTINRFFSAVLSAAVVVTVSTASAAPTFDYSGQVNSLHFTGQEVILRADAGSSYGGLTGWHVVTGTEAPGTGGATDYNSVQVGDITVQILQGTSLDVGGNSDVWDSTATDRFKMYAIQQVTSVGTPPQGPTDTPLDAGVTVPPTQVNFGAITSLAQDPFSSVDGLTAADIASKVTAKFYVDQGSGAQKINVSGSPTPTLQQGVQSAVHGSLWGSFGFGAATDQAQGGASGGAFFYGNPVISGNPPNTTGDSYLGLNVVQPPSPGLVFTGGHENNDQEYTNQLTSLWGTSKFDFYSNGPLASSSPTSYWSYHIDDPLSFAAVPEPTTAVAWLGLGFVFATPTLRRRIRSLIA